MQLMRMLLKMLFLGIVVLYSNILTASAAMITAHNFLPFSEDAALIIGVESRIKIMYGIRNQSVPL